MENFNEIIGRVNVKAMVITPQLAQEFLTKNIVNRRLNKDTVANYERNMASGLFTISNDAICFGTNGLLLNGQHRLTACCKSGKPFIALVAKGFPIESYVVMDNGKNRSAGDVLYVQGTLNSALVAAIIRRNVLLNKSNVATGAISGSKQKISNSEIESLFNENKVFWTEITEFAKKASTTGRYHNLIVGSEIGAMSSYLIQTLKHPKERVFRFFNEISGREQITNSVITLLQDKLRESKNFIAKRLPPTIVQKLIIKAWNAYVKGKTYKVFYYNEQTDRDLWFI